MPSSFHSTAAGLSFSIATSMSAAGEASIGRMPRPTCSPISRSAGTPPAIAVGGDVAEVAVQHHRAAQLGGRHLRGLGGGVGHHALERALAHSARQQRAQEALLALGGAREQLAQRSAARACEPAPLSAPMRANAASTSASPSDGSPAGAGSSCSAAHPTPICRCRSSPDRNATAIAASSGEASRSASASAAILPPRALVALTVSEAAATSSSNTMREYAA